jgi:GT2 family glycosyltransferase
VSAKLSIVIVNYNVQYFLEQCLISIEKAIKNIPTEVFVVDNNSVDQSVEIVKQKFPWVKLIESNINLGFSKGNNLAINKCVGDYILLINPDTLVEEDTFEKCIEFMDNHPEAGGLGVKMMDGKGNFLPESKRSLPTPTVAFYKIFGLSNLFPKSKKFGRYHLGHLNEDENHSIEILSGAFMWMRKKALDQVGILDEDFFMYGEDIDLSYRIIKGGWKNYYFSGTRIIHYKGESTKKSSVNYVFVFYNAMIIFAKKHFNNKNALVFSFLIKLAIYFRAGLAIVKRFLEQISHPITDFILAYTTFFAVKKIWENKFRSDIGLYPKELMTLEIPLFILIIIAFIFFLKGYKNLYNIPKLIKSLVIGFVSILIIYSLLGENYRFSRAIILFGSILSCMLIISSRYISYFIKTGTLYINPSQRKRILIIGENEEVNRVSKIMHQSNFQPKFFGKISPSNVKSSTDLGTLDQINEIIMIHKINEIIFCSKNLSAQQIMSIMEDNKSDLEFKIAPEESLFVIGSNSIHSPGELYLIDINSLNKKNNQRNKRLFDLLTSMAILLILPFIIWFFKNKYTLLKNVFEIFTGKKSWVGYSDQFTIQTNLPKLKKGVFSPVDAFDKNLVSEDVIRTVNLKYVNDYKVSDDLNILLKGLRNN